MELDPDHRHTDGAGSAGGADSPGPTRPLALSRHHVPAVAKPKPRAADTSAGDTLDMWTAMRMREAVVSGQFSQCLLRRLHDGSRNIVAFGPCYYKSVGDVVHYIVDENSPYLWDGVAPLVNNVLKTFLEIARDSESACAFLDAAERHFFPGARLVCARVTLYAYDVHTGGYQPTSGLVFGRGGTEQPHFDPLPAMPELPPPGMVDVPVILGYDLPMALAQTLVDANGRRTLAASGTPTVALRAMAAAGATRRLRLRQMSRASEVTSTSRASDHAFLTPETTTPGFVPLADCLAGYPKSLTPMSPERAAERASENDTFLQHFVQTDPPDGAFLSDVIFNAETLSGATFGFPCDAMRVLCAHNARMFDVV